LPDYELTDQHKFRVPVLHSENLIVCDPPSYMEDQITVFVFEKDIKIGDWVLKNIE